MTSLGTKIVIFAVLSATLSLVQGQDTAVRPHPQPPRDDNAAFIKEHLATNTKLTDDQKTELASFLQRQYPETVSFRDAKFKDVMAFLDKTAADASLTMEQKKTAIQDYIKAAKAKTPTHHAEQKADHQTLKEKMKRGAGSGTGITPGAVNVAVP